MLLSSPKSVTVNYVSTETGSLVQWFVHIIKFPVKNWSSYSTGPIREGL